MNGVGSRVRQSEGEGGDARLETVDFGRPSDTRPLNGRAAVPEPGFKSVRRDLLWAAAILVALVLLWIIVGANFRSDSISSSTNGRSGNGTSGMCCIHGCVYG